jgi:two-component system, chemotaxis family, sensor kinase CheA
VDRVEDIEPDQIARSSGRAFVRIDGRLVPALNGDDTDDQAIKSLRLHAGRDVLSYLIGDVLDIIEVPAQLDMSVPAGRIAGLVMVGEAQIEMIDPFTLFAEAAGDRAVQGGARPIRCLIADEDDAWMRGILAPLLRQAGHEVLIGPAASCVTPDIILCSDDAEVCGAGKVPVLTLCDSAESVRDRSDAIYRYDRDRIIAAIASLTLRDAA